MGESVVGEQVVMERVVEAVGLTIWAVAEDWPPRRGKKAGGNRQESEAGAKSKSKSKAAGEGARSTSSRSTRGLTTKQLGEIAEAEFIAKAVGMGFVVAKPWGDSEPYDFIVNVRREFNFWRVQVKSAHTVGEDGTCSFRAHDHRLRSYRAEDIDALVAYARPSEAWYVFPVRVVEGLKSLKLYPGSRKGRSRYEKWREAWEILRKVVRRARRK